TEGLQRPTATRAAPTLRSAFPDRSLGRRMTKERRRSHRICTGLSSVPNRRRLPSRRLPQSTPGGSEMHISLSRRPARLVVLVVLAFAVAALLLFALNVGGGGAVAQARSHHAAHHAKHHARHHTRAADPSSPADPDNVQSGGQSTPDTPGETSGQSES